MNEYSHNMPEQYLTVSQAASLLFVSTQTLRRWEEQNLIAVSYTVGGHRRYKLSDV